MDMKRGTPGFGIVIGILLVALGALVMIIGFWRTLVLALLFGIGYFLGTVENKGEFLKNAANKLIPDKEAKMIDLKSELARDQEMQHTADFTEETPESAEPEKKQDEE
jgi:uncharacterized membrane protein